MIGKKPEAAGSAAEEIHYTREKAEMEIDLFLSNMNLRYEISQPLSAL